MAILGWYFLISFIVCFFIGGAIALKFWSKHGSNRNKECALLLIRLTLMGICVWPYVMWEYLHKKAEQLSEKGEQ